MFECKACVFSCIRAIAGDSFPVLRRVASRRNQQHSSLTSYPRLRRYQSTRTSLNDLTPVATDRPKVTIRRHDSGETSAALKSRSSVDRRALQTELRYLDDPLKLAEHVHYILRCNQPEKALELCRMASKTQGVVVSWNHCIDWLMSRGKFNSALKVYNEMKKRAQFPDSYTYTIVLRGLAARQTSTTPEIKQANVARAVSIYNSLSTPGTRVRPNILHTNATLTVCSEAQDMDALWGIIARMPQSGAGSADHATYAILLNALRQSAFPDGESEGIHNEQLSARRADVVQQGRKIWLEVIRKWKAGDILIDERLVLAMGRLLLSSERLQDWDDVLSLVNQTMNVERQIAPIGSPERSTEHVPMDHTVQSEPDAGERSEVYRHTLAARAFNGVNTTSTDDSTSRRPSSLIYVQPGNPTLSLLIGTCTQLRVLRAAWAYWDLLTKSIAEGGIGLKPDRANFHAQLRLLNKNRSSAKAVTLLKDGFPAAGLEPNTATFRIAMSICQRDINNPNIMTNARDIIKIMEKTLAEPDTDSLQRYLEIALGTKKGPVIVETLDHLDPILHSLKSKVSYGSIATLTNRASRGRGVVTDVSETLALFQAVIGAIDSLMQRGMVPHEDFVHWHGRRNQLISYLGRQRQVLQKRRGRQEEYAESRRDADKAEKELDDDSALLLKS